MALPALPAWALVTVVVSIAGATGFVAYELRGTVKSVQEVFTSDKSALNNILFQAVLGAIASIVILRMIK